MNSGRLVVEQELVNEDLSNKMRFLVEKVIECYCENRGILFNEMKHSDKVELTFIRSFFEIFMSAMSERMKLDKHQFRDLLREIYSHIKTSLYEKGMI